MKTKKHCAACENAKPKTRCKCSCGGVFHAINNIKNETEGRAMNEQVGGELGEMIKKLKGKRFECLGTCHKKHTIRVLLAYPHDGGLADKDGKKWWLYYECDDCGYQTSWWKIQRRIEEHGE
jgi:hypothetical protein